MINGKTNIFEYAPKELSQDAIISYLFDCFNSQNKAEKEIGKKIISIFCKMDENNITKTYSSVKIIKQSNYIDILILLNRFDNKLDAVVIEDKIYSSIHDSQLERYKKSITSTENFGDINKILFAFFKPYFVTDHERLECEKQGYSIYKWNDIKAIFTGNDNLLLDMIFSNFEENNKFFQEIDEIFKTPSWKSIQTNIDENMGNRYFQNKLLEYIMQRIDKEHYNPLRKYDVNNYGRACTQYRFVFSNEDLKNENWNIGKNAIINEKNNLIYFFRLDKSKKFGWYISINQYRTQRTTENLVRNELLDIVNSDNYCRVHNKADNKGNLESKIYLCPFKEIVTDEEFEELIVALSYVYKKIINYVKTSSEE